MVPGVEEKQEFPQARLVLLAGWEDWSERGEGASEQLGQHVRRYGGELQMSSSTADTELGPAWTYDKSTEQWCKCPCGADSVLTS